MNTGWARFTMQYGLYRDTNQGWVMGVCAGLAQWRGIKTGWVRIGFVLFGLLLHAIPAVLLYAALAALMKPVPLAAPGPMPENFVPRYTAPPPVFTPTLAPLQARFAALDARLNQIEAAVTSEDIALRRQFRDIGI